MNKIDTKINACEELNAPEHLSSDVIVSALYVNNGKDKEERSNRIEQMAKMQTTN